MNARTRHADANPQRAGDGSQRAGTGPQRADAGLQRTGDGTDGGDSQRAGNDSQHADDAPQRPNPRPLVSIVVSFYNDEPYLERTMTGIANQTYDNIELIMVDDGSTDAGLAIVRRYAARDPRIRVVSKPNTGVSSSRNAGLERANGEWLYFADADDWMARDAIERFVEAACASPECDLVVSSFFRVHGMNAALKSNPSRTRGEVSREYFLSRMRRRPANLYYASLWNKFFRRSIIEENGLRLDTSIDFGEDHVFILGYLSCVRAVSLIERGLYYYVDNPDSLLHQGLHPAGVVRMKCDTIRPYRRLFIEAGLYGSPLQKLGVLLFAFMPSTDYFVYEGSRELDPHEVPDHILPASGEERDARIAELAAGEGGVAALRATADEGAAAAVGAARGEEKGAAVQGEGSAAAGLPTGKGPAPAATAEQGERPGHAT